VICTVLAPPVGLFLGAAVGEMPKQHLE